MPSIQCAPPLSREEYSYMAMVAEEAERFDEMGRIIEEMVRRTSSLGEFAADERNLIAIAHKKMVDARRASWRKVVSVESQEGKLSSEFNPKIVKSFRKRIEAELDEICGAIISLLGSHLIPSASTSEAKVFFLKMKGDYHRYLAEFKVGDGRKHAALRSIAAYKEAEDIALVHLAPTNPARLGLALNFSVFCFEILNLSENARQIAQQAFKEAIGDLDKLAQDSYSHARLQLQSLQDNLTLWNYDIQDEAVKGC
ncbi:14-3-3-like protein GF14 kappa [Dendrobium catenatum]|uniref:14-3-3-like protein GF14 kappa n=1 Tax=Dendrobium catenatum TaxID=906689 RepID=A0A2I0V8M2_9ASPA|nr:14-3-3-like protein GF14 kappa [Dendrobium catenatum]PKU59760.1 14-3-3-like protein GF14 kappa [Dendrobium catenatum]